MVGVATGPETRHAPASSRLGGDSGETDLERPYTVAQDSTPTPPTVARYAGPGPESGYAWLRLAVSILISAIGGVGLWSGVVTLPVVQEEFGVARNAASLPYTVTMITFAIGGILMGRLADRFGILVPLILGTVVIAAGYFLAGFAQTLWQFIAVQGLLIGLLGAPAMFSPLIADISHWFTRRRGIAVAACASGNYLAGTVWPPVIQHFVAEVGWRQTHMGIGLICIVTIPPLLLLMRKPSPVGHEAAASAGGSPSQGAYAAAAPAFSPTTLQALLLIAGFSCCVAMSMPQVHIVAYCGDLGYGPARGAEMLSLMLGFGIVSRLASGFIADRIGGLRTLILGSTLQMIALAFYLPFDGLTSLYIVSALFGLSQGGIVPSYAIIVRELLPAREAGARIGLVMMATILGMAAGGWASGLIFDLTGSYRAAFIHGIGWNLLNIAIAATLIYKARGGIGRVQPA